MLFIRMDNNNNRYNNICYIYIYMYIYLNVLNKVTAL